MLDNINFKNKLFKINKIKEEIKNCDIQIEKLKQKKIELEKECNEVVKDTFSKLDIGND